MLKYVSFNNNDNFYNQFCQNIVLDSCLESSGR